jgi:hypothetical protein
MWLGGKFNNYTPYILVSEKDKRREGEVLLTNSYLMADSNGGM